MKKLAVTLLLAILIPLSAGAESNLIIVPRKTRPGVIDRRPIIGVGYIIDIIRWRLGAPRR